MWFHAETRHGAGLFQGEDLDRELQRVGKTEVKERPAIRGLVIAE